MQGLIRVMIEPHPHGSAHTRALEVCVHAQFCCTSFCYQKPSLIHTLRVAVPENHFPRLVNSGFILNENANFLFLKYDI